MLNFEYVAMLQRILQPMHHQRCMHRGNCIAALWRQPTLAARKLANRLQLPCTSGTSAPRTDVEHARPPSTQTTKQPSSSPAIFRSRMRRHIASALRSGQFSILAEKLRKKWYSFSVVDMRRAMLIQLAGVRLMNHPLARRERDLPSVRDANARQ